ncbi:MAG TPA: dihydroneopterin aldolase, partial [Alphaproteobacteria bacterium]|nr:dihydroneopterin aldolase [Alphaproteobacteria bacterium]
MNTLFKTVTNSASALENDEKVISFQHVENVEQTIFIKNLELDMSIGVFDAEKSAKQRVIVDVELTVQPSANW